MGMLSLHCFPAPLSPRAEGWQTLLPKDNKSKQTTKTAKKKSISYNEAHNAY